MTKLKDSDYSLLISSTDELSFFPSGVEIVEALVGIYFWLFYSYRVWVAVLFCSFYYISVLLL